VYPFCFHGVHVHVHDRVQDLSTIRTTVANIYTLLTNHYTLLINTYTLPTKAYILMTDVHTLVNPFFPTMSPNMNLQKFTTTYRWVYCVNGEQKVE
jgi:hypothetical protein